MMRRKSDRKSKTSPEKKTPERPSRLTLRRRRQKSISSSPEREKKQSTSENEIDSTPIIESNVPSKETSNSNSEEEKQEEQPVWQVKSAETPPGGEIQKLKICLQRPSSTPERAEKSPRRHRKHRGGASSYTDEDSSEGKVKSKSSRKRRHQDNDEEIVESSSEDKVNKIHQVVKDEQNSSDSQQVSSTDIDENSKLCDKEDTAGTPPPGELNEEVVGTTSILHKTMSEDDTTSHQNGPESTTVIEEAAEDVTSEEVVEDKSEAEKVMENEPEKSLTPEIIPQENMEVNESVVEETVVEEVVSMDVTQTVETVTENPQEIVQETPDPKSCTPEPPIQKPDEKSEIPEPSVLKPEEEKSETPEPPILKPEDEKSETPEPPVLKPEAEKSETPEPTIQKVGEEKSETPEPPTIQKVEEEKSENQISEDKKSETPEPPPEKTESEAEKSTEIKSITPEPPIEKLEEEKSKTPEPPTEKHVEKSKTPEPVVEKIEENSLKTIESETNDLNQSQKMEVEENSVVIVEKSVSIVKEDVEEVKKKISTEKMDVEKPKTPARDEECIEKMNNENHKQKNEKENNIDVPRETRNDSSGDDETSSPVRSSVVSVVNQVQTYEPESLEEQSTYVADPSRKKLKLKEAITAYIHTKLRLTSDNVREICPDLKVLSLDEIHLEDESRSHHNDDETIVRKAKKKPFDDKKITIQTVKEFTATPTMITTPPITSNPMLANRKISIVGDDANNLHRPPSPAKNEQSPILYIKNLVRPFTLNQLKELLSRTGTIKENGFWINKIKSECYVLYETLEQSVETRNALHGVHWPVANGRRLDVDFGTEEAMEKARTPTDIKQEIKTEMPVMTTTTTTTPEIKPKEEPVDWREVRERERLRREQRGVREWDVGKQGPERSPTPPVSKRRQHTPPSRTTSPDRKSRKKEDVPSKLLDDLFKKTKATPCIYWLPLSAEMIVIKEEQRRKHMAEHERRLAEIRRVERMRRTAPPGGRGRDGGRSRYN